MSTGLRWIDLAIEFQPTKAALARSTKLPNFPIANKSFSFIFQKALKDLLSILSKQVEHNKWPFLLQKVFLDLSISLRQIKHLKIGDIIKVKF